MIVVDGTTGEGGGQVLRSSLALSAATGQPFRITNIRKKRSKPGLLRQHLTSVLAAKDVAGAEVEGAKMGGTELVFRPKKVSPGAYTFQVGTAGSCMLVLATVLLPLALAGGESTVSLEGGTHNPAAPPFPFVQDALLPALAKLGIAATARLVRPGFYPAGGGLVEVTIAGSSALRGLSLLSTGKLISRRARAIVSALPNNVAVRELEAFTSVAGFTKHDDVRPEIVKDALGPGNVVVASLAYEHTTLVVTAFGEKGVPAERVGGALGAEVTALAAAGVPVCEHLADQLLLPMALGRGGAFRTVRPTPHFDAQCTVLGLFLGAEVRVRDEGDGTFHVEVPARRTG